MNHKLLLFLLFLSLFILQINKFIFDSPFRTHSSLSAHARSRTQHNTHTHTHTHLPHLLSLTHIHPHMSWCNEKHDGRVFQRYMFESRRGKWALFPSCHQLYLSSFSDTHTHTHTHTHTPPFAIVMHHALLCMQLAHKHAYTVQCLQSAFFLLFFCCSTSQKKKAKTSGEE